MNNAEQYREPGWAEERVRSQSLNHFTSSDLTKDVCIGLQNEHRQKYPVKFKEDEVIQLKEDMILNFMERWVLN